MNYEYSGVYFRSQTNVVLMQRRNEFIDNILNYGIHLVHH